MVHGRTDRRTDRVFPIYPPQTLFAGGIITCHIHKYFCSVGHCFARVVPVESFSRNSLHVTTI